MLMTTRRAACAQSAARLMCPACRFPIVGANAMLSPAARHSAIAARTAPTLWTTCRVLFAATAPLHSIERSTCGVHSLREAVLLGRVAAILDAPHVRAQGFERRVAAR